MSKARRRDAANSDSSLELQLTELTLRVARLEAAAHESAQAHERGLSQRKTGVADELDNDKYWALTGLARSNRRLAESGEDTHLSGGVIYAGDVALPGGKRYLWQRESALTPLLALNWADLGDTIAALAHPVRLAMLKACLGESRSTQDLLALEGMGTSGQLFHHLKTLQGAGWLRSLQRGQYEVPAERVVPLLAILSAAQG
jgi:hypothetical protein